MLLHLSVILSSGAWGCIPVCTWAGGVYPSMQLGWGLCIPACTWAEGCGRRCVYPSMHPGRKEVYIPAFTWVEGYVDRVYGQGVCTPPPLPRRQLTRSVCILLECILASNILPNFDLKPDQNCQTVFTDSPPPPPLQNWAVQIKQISHRYLICIVIFVMCKLIDFINIGTC